MRAGMGRHLAQATRDRVADAEQGTQAGEPVIMSRS